MNEYRVVLILDGKQAPGIKTMEASDDTAAVAAVEASVQRRPPPSGVPPLKAKPVLTASDGRWVKDIDLKPLERG